MRQSRNDKRLVILFINMVYRPVQDRTSSVRRNHIEEQSLESYLRRYQSRELCWSFIYIGRKGEVWVVQEITDIGQSLLSLYLQIPFTLLSRVSYYECGLRLYSECVLVYPWCVVFRNTPLKSIRGFYGLWLWTTDIRISYGRKTHTHTLATKLLSVVFCRFHCPTVKC